MQRAPRQFALAEEAQKAPGKGAKEGPKGAKPAPHKPASDKPAHAPKAEEVSEEVELPLAEVPPEVRKAADVAVPKAMWETAYRHEEGKRIVYELCGEDESGRDVAVTILSDGKVEMVETEIAPEDVPEVVQAALKKKFPHFVIESVYEVTQEGKVAAYEFEGKRPKDKEEIGVYVSPDGQQITVDEN